MFVSEGERSSPMTTSPNRDRRRVQMLKTLAAIDKLGGEITRAQLAETCGETCELMSRPIRTWLSHGYIVCLRRGKTHGATVYGRGKARVKELATLDVEAPEYRDMLRQVMELASVDNVDVKEVQAITGMDKDMNAAFIRGACAKHWLAFVVGRTYTVGPRWLRDREERAREDRLAAMRGVL